MPRFKEHGFLTELGKKVGIGYKGAEKWIKGESMPDMANATLLARALDVSLDWLMTGRPPKRIGEAQQIGAREADVKYFVKRDELQLAKAISSLPTKTRDALKHLIETLQRKGEQE